MLRLIGTIVGIALFCWATVSAFSIFSELKFLVDGWTWSVDQVQISIKSVALVVGKYVSGIVGGYREFVHGLVQMLHLPKLPQVVYDAGGMACFSVGRGYWLGERSRKKVRAYEYRMIDLIGSKEEERQAREARRFVRAHPLWFIITDVQSYIGNRFAPFLLGRSDKITKIKNITIRTTAMCLVYGTAVAVVLTALFGIDFLYRHFA
jgi:hypothetical protein